MNKETQAGQALVDHKLADASGEDHVLYQKKPARTPAGEPIDGLYHAWITLNNQKQYNSYTTQMVKDVILSFNRASNERDVVTVIFTGSGDKAFCTGGNTKEYAEYYAGNPQEYRQYMRLFNDMVSAILGCDKPVICRVNGMRIGGGQEIGMACDFSITQDLAKFGQAGPKHGSAPIGGATDFLPIMIGCEQAMVSGSLCDRFEEKRQRLWPGYSPSAPRDLLDWVVERVAIPGDEWDVLLGKIALDHEVEVDLFLEEIADKIVRVDCKGATFVCALERLDRIVGALGLVDAEARIQERMDELEPDGLEAAGECIERARSALGASSGDPSVHAPPRLALGNGATA